MSDLFNREENSSIGVTEGVSDILPPRECSVIFYNDDYTTKDFVVDVLVNIFNKGVPEAEDLMETVHNAGSAVVGSYTYDIALSRTNITTQLARKNGFPLRVEIEQD
ncbi:MAG: ATP-dependent Clp protease adaptor ClpS [Treponema sp.]|nr:ATP-dependent Clp protease adaptor ClpS [Treponema sp.]